VPTLLTHGLKNQLAAFLVDNNVPFAPEGTRADLLKLVREALSQAGINPDYFNIVSGRELQPLSHLMLQPQDLLNAQR
jgi:hypothetical protein